MATKSNSRGKEIVTADKLVDEVDGVADVADGVVQTVDGIATSVEVLRNSAKNKKQKQKQKQKKNKQTNKCNKKNLGMQDTTGCSETQRFAARRSDKKFKIKMWRFAARWDEM